MDYQPYPLVSLQGKVIIVTGASAGIGAEIAKALVTLGAHVVGVARRKSNLDKLADSFKHLNGSFYPLEANLGQDEDINGMFNFTKEKFGGIDVLVNNAAIFREEAILNGASEHYRRMLDINTVAPTAAMREGVKSILDRGNNGHIVNILSIVALDPMVTPMAASLYEASKVALYTIAKKLRGEIAEKRYPIRITNICPGLTRSELFEKGGCDEEALYQLHHLQPQHIAACVVFALQQPPNCEIELISPRPLHGI